MECCKNQRGEPPWGTPDRCARFAPGLRSTYGAQTCQMMPRPVSICTRVERQAHTRKGFAALHWNPLTVLLITGLKMRTGFLERDR
jgi:hypothetical protein